MNWLIKLLKIFQEKENTEEKERIYIERNSEYKKDTKGKDLETRVTYHYPKGNLRFPLNLVDEKQTSTHNLIRPKREERKKVSSLGHERTLKKVPIDFEERPKRKQRSTFEATTPHEQRRFIKEQNPLVRSSAIRELKHLEIRTESETVPKERRSEIKTKITKKSSRPFSPTEIPSPIYGYTKRPLQSTVVEYELTSEKAVLDNYQSTSYQQEPEDELIFEDYVPPILINEKIVEDVISQPFIDEEAEDEIPTIDSQIDEIIVAPRPNTPISKDIVIEDKDKNPIDEEIEKKTSQRKHLPFNVLMLKDDQRKWESKQFEQAFQIESTTSLEASKPEINESPFQNEYTFPSMNLLNPPMTRFAQENAEWTENQELLLNEALKNFGVRASVVNITPGPSVTRFEVQPEPGVKVNKITNLSDDIKLSLAAKDIRIEAPIPGKHTIGIEVPNKKSRPVLISEIIKSEVFQNSSSPLTAVLGLDISGTPVVTDIKKMPHGLIAGATGSGKSVCINSILISLLYKASPKELKLLLIDPKMVELAPYNHIPHLVSPVITDVKAATAALKWAVDEMERRYELFAHAGTRDINRFNEIAESNKRYSDKLPFIVIIIDELADLMMMSPADVEESICRIAQKARACGIHLIIATQRPSVDVITGLIKANVPTRTAFSVSSQIDSRTIIDISGAEKLLGRGDMLFLENGSSKPVRLQGTFVSDAEIDLVVEHVREQQEPDYLFHQEELLKKAQVIEDEDELFYEACEFVVDQGGASTSSLQRRFKIGYNRAARLIDMMEQQGFISEPKGSKPRDVLITEEELEQLQDSSAFI